MHPAPPISATAAPAPTLKKTGTKRSAPQGSPHVCNDCHRQYSRPEHLARHIQTHTLGKRFPCPVCGKAFARTDLLRRHTQNHQNNDGTKKRRTGSAAANTGRDDDLHAQFTDFLCGIMFESNDSESHSFDESTFPALNFCSDVSLELNEADYGLMDYLNLNLELPPDSQSLNSHEEAANLVKLRREMSSIWSNDDKRFATEAEENPWGSNQAHLDVGGDTDCSLSAMEESRKKLYTVFSDKVALSGRDGVLGLVLATCKNGEMVQKVSTTFPSLETMDGFVHMFLASHFCEVSNFIHFPTLKLKDQLPDWLATVVACGAVRTSAPTIQRFGFAVQNSVRVSIALKLENRGDITSHMGLLQSTVLLQDLGLWSGYRSKIVAAESYLSFPVSVLRSKNRYRRAAYPHVEVHADDEGQVLEEKWKTWYNRESWKRIVFHCYVRDAQWSIHCGTNPLMSYCELALPLPEPSELWLAKTATEWKRLYLKILADRPKRVPCLGDLMRDITVLTANLEYLDVQFTISIYLSTMWSLIHEYNQLSSVHGSRSFSNRNLAGSNSNTLLSERHQELYKELRTFRQLHVQWGAKVAMSPQQNMMLHLLMMHLHVCIEDINMFLGHGGEELMRQAYPSLKQWSESTEAREALWHAAQTLRYAKMFPPCTLRDFWVIALFQAGLTIWVYGIVTSASKRKQRQAVGGLRRSGSMASSRPVPRIPGRFMNEPLFLDGEDGTAVMRYLSMGQGQPLIRGPARGSKVEGSVQASPNDPRDCIDAVREILVSNYTDKMEQLPTLAMNLKLMMEHLSRVGARV
ncbi:hypothetical protein TD95_004226 [Thielaviopsis punctulata]|uniref:C2H2-type domain-containing protein n=1 Tax=Thielaviopsis punctulata TaxID=72032 RepID=A0A0F4ZD76_9PEZI|nr:hypothetical protein TD95_004226 [Thielaviopsis punctulata]